MNQRDLIIWAAGFFDGEGCVSLSRPVTKGKYAKEYVTYQLQTVIAQRDKRPMDLIVDLFGGRVTSVQIHGSVYWYYRLHGQKAAAFLEKLLPYLQLKREQAELALRFQELYEATRPKSQSGVAKGRWVTHRTPEVWAELDSYYRQNRLLNTRHRQKDYTRVEQEPSSSTVQ